MHIYFHTPWTGATHRVSTTSIYKHSQREMQVPSRWHTMRPQLSVEPLKKPAKEAALICTIALEHPSYNPLCKSTSTTLQHFIILQNTQVCNQMNTLSWHAILCAPVPHKEEPGWPLVCRKLEEKGHVMRTWRLYIHNTTTNHHWCWRPESWNSETWYFKCSHTVILSNLRGGSLKRKIHNTMVHNSNVNQQCTTTPCDTTR